MTGSSRRYTSSIWRWSKDAPGKNASNPSPKALADLERRKALGPRPDLTGRLLGDPPPGRSALDRKREEERLVREAFDAMEQPEAVEERARAWSERGTG